MRLRRRDLPAPTEEVKKMPSPLPFKPDNTEILEGQRAVLDHLDRTYTQVMDALKAKKTTPSSYTFSVKRNSRGLIDSVIARPVHADNNYSK